MKNVSGKLVANCDGMKKQRMITSDGIYGGGRGQSSESEFNYKISDHLLLTRLLSYKVPYPAEVQTYSNIALTFGFPPV